MSNTSSSVTPERILQFVWAFAPPLAIEAAIRHHVFDVLAKRPVSIAELAQATGASTRGLSAITDLLVGFALLTRDDERRYALTPESDTFLVSHKPSFMGGIFRHMSSQLLPNWLQLSEIVGSGRPATAVNSVAEGAPFFAQFVEDILPLSYPSARMLADALNLAQATGPVSVLDLASGSGVWGIALAQASPHVTVCQRRGQIRIRSESADFRRMEVFAPVESDIWVFSASAGLSCAARPAPRPAFASMRSPIRSVVRIAYVRSVRSCAVRARPIARSGQASPDRRTGGQRCGGWRRRVRERPTRH